MASYVLALDLGTSGVKAMVADLAGVCHATCSAQAPVHRPRGGPSLAREFSPERLWSAIVSVSRQALAAARITGKAVAAIGVTSQRQGVALLDRAGRDLYLGPNTDLRAVFEGAAQDEQHRDLFYRTTGHLPPFFLAPAKLRWLQLNHPRAYEQVHSVLSLADWVVFRLTSECAGERALAGEAGLLEIANGRWACDLMNVLGLRNDWFPPLVASGAVVGGLTKGAAREMGFSPGTPVVAAGPDTQCGLLGMGVANPGQVGVVAGWSMTAQQVTEAPHMDEGYRVWVGLHPLPGRWVSEVNLGDAGATYLWTARLLYGGGSRAVARMEREAATAMPGGNGTVAILGPAPLDMSRLGLRTGGLLMPAPVSQATLGRAGLARAAMEGTVFALRDGLERLEEAGGAPISAVALGGGMARGGLVPRLIADICNREVRLAALPNVSTYGAALAGAVAVGAFGSLQRAARFGAQRTAGLQPDPNTALQYNDLYERWRRLRKRVEELPLE